MPVDHRELAFEAAIEHHLTTVGDYAKGDPAAFDRELALFPDEFLAFVRATQPETWKALEKLHAAATGTVMLDDLTKALDGQAGSLGVIRHGFKCFGKLIHAAYFAPAHGMNPESRRHYNANRLTVTRQVHYGNRHQNSLDMVLSLNGIPVATAELKNPLTGQNAEHAKHQYHADHDPRERIFDFNRRALVHFAVDPDVVWMTTRLDSGKTYFLSFNRGCRPGVGNPPYADGYKTAYLWQEVWQRDSLLDILGRFAHLQVDEKAAGERKFRKETMIFPCYHQLAAVRGLEADAKSNGAGHNYLIQHSAGSGKSNSIAWLAHRLASLHNAADAKVFDSVVVITDRLGLDRPDPDATGVTYTEPDMNWDASGSLIREKELLDRFATDRYQVLLVAEMYQTGFDQPLLHTMYVDKRLNRTCPGKNDTFVLDFVNNAEDIQAAFKPYYEERISGEQAESHQLYELQGQLEAMHVFYRDDVDCFCEVFFKPKAVQSPADLAAMNARLDPAVSGFHELDEAAQQNLRALLNAFRNIYGFLSQVIPFHDSDLERLYTYTRFFTSKLPHRSTISRYAFDDEVSLKFYPLQKISGASIKLDEAENTPLAGPTVVGNSKSMDEQIEPSRLFDSPNERFSTEFSQAYELFFMQLHEEAIADESLRQAAVANTIDNFRFVFTKALEGLSIDRMDQNGELFAKYMNDVAFKKVVSEHLLRQACEQIRSEGAA